MAGESLLLVTLAQATDTRRLSSSALPRRALGAVRFYVWAASLSAAASTPVRFL